MEHEPEQGQRAKPFLKWAGGKTRYAARLAAWAPPFTGTYWEPFMGSAAVFFHVQPGRAVLSDLNAELVVGFREVARDPHEVMDLLDSMPNTREHYLATREQDPLTLTAPGRAARVIYLNKTGFRGLWRVNRQGKFNVPYGEYSRPYYNRDNLLRASKALAGVEVLSTDYSSALNPSQPGDWVYLDPPYVPDRPWGDFRWYTSEQFFDKDRYRIATMMREAGERSVFVMMTNSDTPRVRDAYSGFHMRKLRTRRDIHLKASERASIDLVITNYEVPSDTLFDEDVSSSSL